MELCSRMHVCVSVWTSPHMTSHLCLLILSSLAVSSQLGLEDVFFSPKDQTVKEGEGVFLRCVSGESLPPASITWIKDGSLVTRGRQIQGEYGGGQQKKTSGTLHLFNVTLEDDGTYVCVTRNPLLNINKESQPAKLTVQGVLRRLQIVHGPENISVAMGTEVSMHCEVRGFPVPMVHWFKDCLLINCSASFSLHNNGQLLTFRNVTREDEGSYYCEASNQKESIKSQPAFLLPAEMDWSFVQQPTDLTVKRGQNVTVTCRPPYSRPAAQVSWFKNNQLVVLKAHVTVLQSGDLFFQSVQETDSGSYFCRASNIHLQRFLTSRRAALTVLAPPSVTVHPQVLTVPLGARVALECHVSGHPRPSISWVKRGQSKQTGGKIALGLRNATIYFHSARSYDEGVYVCEASNTLGQSRNTAVLRVAVSPIIASSAGQVSCRIGASAVLPCKAVGILPITYTWIKGRTETQTPISPGYVDGDGALHISNVQYSDAGEFYCTAENRAGRHQKLTILTVLAELRPTDRGKQTRLVLSASTNTSEEFPVSQLNGFLAEQHLETRHLSSLQAQHKDTTCSLPNCDATTNRASKFARGEVAELKMPPRGLGRILEQHQNQPTTNPTHPLVTQMQPPMLPPPPHPNFQSAHLYNQPPATRDSLFIYSEPPITHSQTSEVASEVSGTNFQYKRTESQSHVTLITSRMQFKHPVSDPMGIKPDSQGSNIQTVTVPMGGSIGLLKLDSHLIIPTQSAVTQTETRYSGSVTESSASQAQFHQFPTQPYQLVTKGTFYQSYHDLTSTKISQTGLEDQSQPLHQQTNQPPSSTPSQISDPDPQQSFGHRLFPKFHLELSTIQHHTPAEQPESSVTKPEQTQTHSQPSPTMPTISTILQSSATEHPLLHSQAPLPKTETTLPKHKNPLTIQPSISTIHPPVEASNPSTSDREISVDNQVNSSDQVQLNATRTSDPVQPAQSSNDTELTEWLKRNTSQSPMTSNDRRETEQTSSWLPVLEKHDVPIVVGVGVSLAFIFITVTFYSVIQKNEPAPTSRAEPINMSLTVQRNVGVPVRHPEHRAARRTYENRAFEDDECVAVIEQSPNTSDTRARPPGPSLVTVQMEPTFEDLQEDTQQALDNHSVTVETYPEPILDTKIDPSLDEEKGRSLSQPSIQLQCAEDWTSHRGDNRSPCHDALPPPSPLPSRSASPSPPSRQERGLRSSLTLQGAEAGAAPIHHSLSISHGNPPLLLSHHVSLGLTTVAVDVHFYPAATASMAVGTSTQINSVSHPTSVAAPMFSAPLVSSQENDQASARFQQSK